MTHTPTPWRLNQPELNKIRDVDGRYVAAFKNDIDAIRAVACVNACAPFEDPDKSIPRILLENEALQAENERLRQGIKDAIAEMERFKDVKCVTVDLYHEGKVAAYSRSIKIITAKTNTQ